MTGETRIFVILPFLSSLLAAPRLGRASPFDPLHPPNPRSPTLPFNAILLNI
jgi:hypothetical protein